MSTPSLPSLREVFISAADRAANALGQVDPSEGHPDHAQAYKQLRAAIDELQELPQTPTNNQLHDALVTMTEISEQVIERVDGMNTISGLDDELNDLQIAVHEARKSGLRATGQKPQLEWFFDDVPQDGTEI